MPDHNYAVEVQDTAEGEWVVAIPVTMSLDEARAIAEERHSKNPYAAVRVADMNGTVAETWPALRDPNEARKELTATAGDLAADLARDLLLQAIFTVNDPGTFAEAERLLNEQRPQR